MQPLEISTKQETQKEKQTAGLLGDIAKTYRLPLFTKKVTIEEGSIPHSHPTLTLNTRVDDKRKLLEVFVHEQFHWFVQESPQYAEIIQELKKVYKDNNECNISGEYPDSFWEHLVVCWNTRNYLSSMLSVEDVAWVYDQWNPYPETEALVSQEFDALGALLELHGLRYTHPITNS